MQVQRALSRGALVSVQYYRRGHESCILATVVHTVGADAMSQMKDQCRLENGFWTPSLQEFSAKFVLESKASLR